MPLSGDLRKEAPTTPALSATITMATESDLEFSMAASTNWLSPITPSVLPAASNRMREGNFPRAVMP